MTDGGRLIFTLEGRDLNLTQLIERVDAEMQKGVGIARNYDSQLNQLTATQQRQESATAAYAQSLARGAVAAGDDAQAIKILASALQTLTPNTTAANNVLTQLQNTLNRQATAAEQAALAARKAAEAQAQAAEQAAARQASAVTNTVAGFQKLITAYFAVTTAAQVFSAAIEAGNTLEKADVTFRALSGSTEAYQKNLNAAREQQARFGGSLQENIDGLSDFANLAKRTGIDIKDLANTARGLATIDPAQGFRGAAIALKELFSGNVSSLARRFEIPREKLNELVELAQTDAPAAFSRLQQVLGEFGVTEELIAANANTTAVQFDKLKGSADDLVASIGQGLASALEGPAKVLTTQLQTIKAGLDGLKGAGDQKLGIEQQLISSATSADEFNAKIRDVNAQLDGTTASTTGLSLILGPLGPLFVNIVKDGLKLNELTQTELDFAQASLQAGVSLQAIQTAITTMNPDIEHLNTVFTQFPGTISGSRAELDTFQAVLLRTAASSDAGAITAQAFAQAVLDGSLTTQEGTAQLLAYLQGIQEVTNANLNDRAEFDRHTAAVDANTTALVDSATKTLEASIQTNTLKNLQADLASLAGAVSAGHLSNAQAAAILAANYGLASGEAERLLALQSQLAGANAAARGFGKGKGVSSGGIAADFGGGAQTQRQRDEIAKDQKALIDSEIALAQAKGNTAHAVDLIRQKQRALNTSTRDGQAEFNRLEAQRISLENKAAKGGGRSPKLTANEKLNNQLLAGEDKFDNQMEDLENKHQQKLLDIIEEFAKKQLEVQKENEIQKRRSRFDFYNDLNKSQLSPLDKQKFAAAYEDAFSEAQKIAQSGRAKLAQEFLALRQRQIKELEDLAQEESEIRSSKDLSKGEKENRLKELEERRKLLLDAQDEEKKQLLEGGDQVQNDFNNRINEENKAYEDQADKITTAAGRAADAKVTNAERSKIAVDAENKALADQYDTYKKIADLNGGSLPSQTPANVATTPAATPIQAPQPLPVQSDKPLPVDPSATPNATLVQQAALFIVRDQGVIDAIGDQTARLESQLTVLNGAVNNMKVELGGRLDGIRSAIGSWKGGNAVRP